MPLTRLREGLFKKLHNAKLLNINLLQPPDTHTYVWISGGCSVLMFKSFTLCNFWISPNDWQIRTFSELGRSLISAWFLVSALLFKISGCGICFLYATSQFLQHKYFILHGNDHWLQKHHLKIKQNRTRSNWHSILIK